jgi:hypothetical protein
VEDCGTVPFFLSISPLLWNLIVFGVELHKNQDRKRIMSIFSHLLLVWKALVPSFKIGVFYAFLYNKNNYL